MARKLFVRNVSRAMDKEALERLFAPFGDVSSATVVHPADPGVDGEAVVEMGSDEQAQAALDALDGQEQAGRRLSVRWAEAAEESGAGQPRMFTPMNMPDEPARPDWPPSPPPPPGSGPLAGGFGDRGGDGGGGGVPRRVPRPLPSDSSDDVR
jgi:RNA recognition motif-containing protein